MYSHFPISINTQKDTVNRSLEIFETNSTCNKTCVPLSIPENSKVSCQFKNILELNAQSLRPLVSMTSQIMTS